MLPQLSGDRLFVTDGGLETTLIFHQGIDLPYFAAFTLLEDEAGAEALRRYYEPYLAIARERGTGIVLDSPTWRASRDWAERLGYSPEQQAEAYHAEQIGTFATTAADMVSAITMTYAEEAIGITRAAKAAGLPAVISFTVETDGRLPSGQPLREAIEQVDAATAASPAYYMINCAHPTHFQAVLEDGPWLERIGGLRANASTMNHAELDEATELDEGDPQQLAADYRALRDRLPKACVLGGCCGTDDRHVAAIAEAWVR